MKSLAKRWRFWLVVVIAAIIVVLHVYLAIWVRDYVNRKLSEIPGYRAHVQAVTLHLWRGAYQIHNIDIKKTNGKVPEPFFSAPLVDLSIQWHALIFERAAVGNIEIHRAKMNLVNGPTPDSRQVDVDAPWAQKIKQLYPLKINRFAVHDGEIHYREYVGDKAEDLPFDHVEMVGTNFTNSKKFSKSLIADIRIEGRPLRAGDARAQISLDPYAKRPTFAVNLEVKELPLVKLNDFAQAHGGFTFKEGTFKMAMEANAKNGGYQGYVEPVFDQMVIFNEQSAQNPGKFVWEAILGALTEIVRNHPKDRFGTKVPFSGSFEDPIPDIFATVFNAFRNAFVQAFEGKLENWKQVPKVEPEKKQ